ncbi:hypothetical protein BFW01_g6895 [Lasiodiplodia theobromae]|uniref:Uncharacterized protein n=1 Tax=Lasiodiplodia theobromae TaxID=45133 RepID=A0A5N5DV55_9PEZI|nr:hypothetical protein DBV05_g432 [Lasiodiplodia theobromae]KAF9636000.1 hypothetical protein BFW01_g6895 [Lasiodiplodia theobromae]
MKRTREHPSNDPAAPSPSRPRTSQRLQRPAFGLPLNWRPERSYGPNQKFYFPNAVAEWSAIEATLRETSMLAVMNLLTDKDEWRRKVFDESIVEHWRKDAVTTEGQGFSDEMFDFCIAELRDKAKEHESTGMVVLFDQEAAAVKSDSIVPSELKEELQAVAKLLEDVPEKDKDWHPNSDNQVLDLVHPSLFPLMYGRSRIIPEEREDCTLDDCFTNHSNEIIPTPSDDEAYENIGSSNVGGSPPLWSKKYQWLPSEVRFDGDADVKITSYINNLHPVLHRNIYPVLEKLIAKAIPAWSLALGIVKARRYKWREDNLRIPCPHGATYEEVWPEKQKKPARPAAGDTPSEQDLGSQDSDDEDYEDSEEDDYVAWREAHRKLVLPQPRAYRPTPSPDYDLRREFAAQGLQVIVKLANIHLTPSNPSYAGGSWHVEGCLNERICATALYYYDEQNITTSRLAFRQRISTDSLYFNKTAGQDDYGGIEYLYGIESDGPAIQSVGKVETREGRLLAFPNVWQHCVEPFELRDKTMPGHRKIVALFLVDPYQRVISTANVPPQQKEWWGREVRGSGVLGKLPEELVQQVLDEVDDWPIGLEEAKEVRLDLMKERRVYQEGVQASLDEATFNFCEH